MAEFPAPDPNNTPRVNPLVNFLSLLWLIPKREVLRRTRFGVEVEEVVAGNRLTVLPDVFNPVIFRTGEYFAKVLSTAELGTGRALDLGCGTGVLGLTMARRGFQVDCVDINPEAVRCAAINAERNGLSEQVTAHHGNLFSAVDGQYDLITFSPPSFRGEPTSKFDLSWRATDVFERFAQGLPERLTSTGLALVLQTSHGDEPGLVRALLDTGLRVDVVARKHFGVEIFSVYRLRH